VGFSIDFQSKMMMSSYQKCIKVVKIKKNPVDRRKNRPIWWNLKFNSKISSHVTKYYVKDSKILYSFQLHFLPGKIKVIL